MQNEVDDYWEGYKEDHLLVHHASIAYNCHGYATGKWFGIMDIGCYAVKIDNYEPGNAATMYGFQKGIPVGHSFKMNCTWSSCEGAWVPIYVTEKWNTGPVMRVDFEDTLPEYNPTYYDYMVEK